MFPQEYDYLLMALDLARMDKQWGFSIMVIKWKVFPEGYLFSTINCDCNGTFDVDRKKMDIGRGASQCGAKSNVLTPP